MNNELKRHHITFLFCIARALTHFKSIASHSKSKQNFFFSVHVCVRFHIIISFLQSQSSQVKPSRVTYKGIIFSFSKMCNDDGRQQAAVLVNVVASTLLSFDFFLSLSRLCLHIKVTLTTRFDICTFADVQHMQHQKFLSARAAAASGFLLYFIHLPKVVEFKMNEKKRNEGNVFKIDVKCYLTLHGIDEVERE